MIIDWMASKTQLFFPEQDDEFYLGLDFALSPEIMNLLYAQNDDCVDAATQQLIAEPAQQEAEEDADAFIAQFELDEYELALA
ncbi:MAG: hypothetical protein ACXV8O_17140 [Methylobacter sp.]